MQRHREFPALQPSVPAAVTVALFVAVASCLCCSWGTATTVGGPATAAARSARGNFPNPLEGGSGVVFPYPKSKMPVSTLFAISEENRTPPELLALDSLAGGLARELPQLYRVSTVDWRYDFADSYSEWLRELAEHGGVTVNDSLASASLQAIVKNFIRNVANAQYLLCNSSNASVSAAITTAAAAPDGHLLLIAGDAATASALQASGLSMQNDLSGATIDTLFAEEPQILANLSATMFFFQDPSKSEFLADYAIFTRGATMPWNPLSPAQATVLAAANGTGGAAAFGWGPENDYVSILNKHGVYVHASDYSKNIAALSNAHVSTSESRPQATTAASARLKSKASLQLEHGQQQPATVNHTVAFLVSDGDNMQFTMGPWGVTPTWWGAPLRGSVPCGWTFPPAFAAMAPAVVSRVKRNRTANDELVAGPSGFGYQYPTMFPAEFSTEFAVLTHTAMQRSDMTTVNVLGQDNSQPQCAQLQALLQTDAAADLPGLIYYPWGSGYAALSGQVYFCAAGNAWKPLVTARFSLWGNSNDTSQPMVGNEAMVEKLEALSPASASSIDSYSLIVAHAWSHNYSDVVAVATALEATGRFDIVLPSELLRRVAANVPHIS